jgi:hypothetical protein
MTALLALLMAMKPLLLGDVGPEVRLVVDASHVREAGAGSAIARQVRMSSQALLRATEVTEGTSDLVVEVSVRTLRGSSLGYATEVALHQGGRRVAVDRTRCSLCTEGEAVAAVQRSLAGLAPKLRTLAHGV